MGVKGTERNMRPYHPRDLASVLSFVGFCLKHSELIGYHPGDIVHWMSNGYKGRALAEHFFLYEKESELVAVADCSSATKRANFALILHPKERGTALEQTLLGECEAFMQARLSAAGIDRASLTINVATEETSRRACLESLGFQAEPSATVVASRSLETFIPDALLPEEFSLRSADGEHEAQKLAGVHNGAFGSSWTPEEYSQVMQTPGFEAERELVVVAPDKRFAAFTVYWADKVSRSGLFEPVGCHKDFRRQGLTKAIMNEGLKRMKASGLKTALVGYTSSNTAAVKLYESVGFKEHFTTVDYKKIFT